MATRRERRTLNTIEKAVGQRIETMTAPSTDDTVDASSAWKQLRKLVGTSMSAKKTIGGATTGVRDEARRLTFFAAAVGRVGVKAVLGC